MAIILSTSHPAVRKLIKKHRKKAIIPNAPSKLEEAFKRTWRAWAIDLPAPVYEYGFHKTRLWRIDFAWPDHKLAVELEGGIWTNGGHTRPLGFLEDIEKYNALTEAGWRILRFAQPHVEEQPFAMIEQIKRCLIQ